MSASDPMTHQVTAILGGFGQGTPQTTTASKQTKEVCSVGGSCGYSEVL